MAGTCDLQKRYGNPIEVRIFQQRVEILKNVATKVINVTN